MFNIPMIGKGAQDLTSLLSQVGGQNTGQIFQAGMNMLSGSGANPLGGMNQMQNNMNQMQNGGNFSDPSYMNPPMDNSFNQTTPSYMNPQANNSFNQTTPSYINPQANNSYNQPTPSYTNPQVNNNYNQPTLSYTNPQANNNYNQPTPSYSNPPQGGGVVVNKHNLQVGAAGAGIGAGAGVHLKKGQKFAVTGQNGAAVQRIRMGLGWTVLNVACDLDASAFMLDQNGRIVGDSWFVFYGQPVSPDGSVCHSGDSKGEGAGDDETIDIDLNRISPNVQRIAFVVTIDEALARGLNFSMVSDAYVRILDLSTNTEMARFSLTDYYSNVTSMVVGELYRYNGTWKFTSVGNGVQRDLAGLCEMYGVNVAG